VREADSEAIERWRDLEAVAFSVLVVAHPDELTESEYADS
jgi:hypothetical protein